MGFTGAFDERDVETAQRTYPGRRVLLNHDAGIEVHPAGTGHPRPLVDAPLGRSRSPGLASRVLSLDRRCDGIPSPAPQPRQRRWQNLVES